MRTVQRAPVAAVVLLVALLAVFQATVGLGVVGWTVGLVASATAAALLAVALHRTRTTRFGPANGVTLVRATLGQAVAALVAASFTGVDHRGLLLGLTALALVLDAVDGRVARRTRSVTRLGARFDMETDAFLILVLSVAAGPPGRLVGPGHRVRPVRVAARRARSAVAPRTVHPATGARWSPRSRASLAVVVTGVLPSVEAVALLLASLGLLAESFGRDVVWLIRRHTARTRRPLIDAAGRHPDGRAARPDQRCLTPTPWRATRTHRGRPHGHGRRGRRVLGVVGTVLAVMLLWAAMSVPNRPEQLIPGSPGAPCTSSSCSSSPWPWCFPRVRTVVAVVVGLAAALVVLLAGLDIGMLVGFYRIRPAVRPVVPRVGVRRAAGQRRRRPGGPRHGRGRPRRPGRPGAPADRRGPSHSRSPRTSSPTTVLVAAMLGAFWVVLALVGTTVGRSFGSPPSNRPPSPSSTSGTCSRGSPTGRSSNACGE